LLTIPRARAFLIEDMRNGGDPGRPHGICEVKLTKLRYTNSAFGTKDRALQSCSPEIMSLSLLRNIPGSLRPR